MQYGPGRPLLALQAARAETGLHRNALKFVAVGKNKIRLKLQAALAKSAEYAHDVVAREELHR
jgi:hypothetical protein